jgi:hypothetical protein
MSAEAAKEKGRKAGDRLAYVLVGMATVVMLIPIFQKGDRFGGWLQDQRDRATAGTAAA